MDGDDELSSSALPPLPILQPEFPTLYEDPRAHDAQANLIDLGQTVLRTIASTLLFPRQDLHCHLRSLAETVNVFIQPSILIQWSNRYTLSKVLYRWNRHDEPLNAFYAFVASVYLQSGLQTVQSWLSALLVSDEAIARAQEIMAKSLQTYVDAAVQADAALGSRKRRAPSPEPQAGPSQQQAQARAIASGYLGSFNERAIQTRTALDWNYTSEGPPHKRKWNVNVYVRGELKGHGVGWSKAAAKEMAAEEAFRAMGWSIFL